MTGRVYPPGHWPLFTDGGHSDEGWRYHMETHIRGCWGPTGPEDVVTMRLIRCPCGATVITSCARCRRPLIVAPIDRAAERCEHYLELRNIGPGTSP